MSAVHDDEVFTSLADESHIVRDIDHGTAVFLFEAIDEFDDAVFDGDIESGGGFIEEEHGGTRKEGHSDDDSLLLPAGYLVRVASHDMFRFWQADVM